MAYRVGPKGQVVISKEIRDQLGVEAGWVALQRLVDDHVEIYFVPPEHNRSLAGVLARYTDVRLPTTEALRQAREQSWQERAREVATRAARDQTNE